MANSAAAPINPKMSNARRDSEEEVVPSENASTKVEETAKKSKLKAGWGKLGLDAGTILMMFKASLPPTVGIAIYQIDAVAGYFGAIGYLVPIITVLSICILPRAKYIQSLILNVIGICIGSAIGLLGVWSGVQARIHTTYGVPAQYNSSQSAVCAVWLFFNIFLANVLRAKIPALQIPVIMYSIFTNVIFTSGPLFTTIEAAESLVKTLLVSFLTAFAISTAVSMFIIPVSSRKVVFGGFTGYIKLLDETMKAQTAYLQSLEKSDMFALNDTGKDQGKVKEKKAKGNVIDDDPALEESLQSKALSGSVSALTALHGKISSDLSFAKRDFAWGKLDATDLDDIFHLLQAIFVPLIGMSTIHDIFQRVAVARGWTKNPESNTIYDDAQPWEHNIEGKMQEQKLWNDIMKQLHEPFAAASEAMQGGLQHAGLLLELLPKPKEKNTSANAAAAADEDVEAKGGSIAPGEKGYGNLMHNKMKDFYLGRGETLRTWAREKGISEEEFNSVKTPTDGEPSMSADKASHLRDHQQLYLILYMEHLLYSTGCAIHNLTTYAEKKSESKMMRNHLIVPGQRRIWKWIKSITDEDANFSESTPDSLEAGKQSVSLGAGYNCKKDPEHLPPTTAWQRFGNGVRTIPRFFGSIEATFGLRAACATMSIGIVAFLETTQVFFVEQRLVWALIIIAIGMTVTSGQSVFGFLARIAGTAISMVISMAIWYIVDQKIPGVIVMLWFTIFIEMYFFLKFPRFLPVWMICIVTQVLILGYEIQVVKIGIKAAAQNGQPYYPVYELAPYRLACVAGGSLVAFVWTIFPYPLTDSSWLRKDLGATIYLLANYYSAVHSTIGARIHNTEGDMTDKQSPGRQLEKIRHKIFGKLLVLLPSLDQHTEWQKFEMTLGGKFPRQQYQAIIETLIRLMKYLSLMSYSTQTFSKDTEDLPESTHANKRVWLDDVSLLLKTIDPTSHAITSVLALLSASVIQGSALPPYMQLPQPFQLSRRLEELDSGILDIRHVEEPGYSTYAVMQVTSSLVTADLKRLVELVKELVGEVDFSFRVIESAGEVGTEKGKKD